MPCIHLREYLTPPAVTNDTPAQIQSDIWAISFQNVLKGTALVSHMVLTYSQTLNNGPFKNTFLADIPPKIACLNLRKNNDQIHM